jgi:hypothetical protein
MAISDGKSRHTVTLPTTFVERLEQERTPGQTFSDILQARVELSYAGETGQLVRLSQDVAGVVAELALVKAVLEKLVEVCEQLVPAREIQKAAETPPIATYEQMYGPAPAEEPAQEPVTEQESVEAAPRRRGWMPWTSRR